MTRIDHSRPRFKGAHLSASAVKRTTIAQARMADQEALRCSRILMQFANSKHEVPPSKITLPFTSAHGPDFPYPLRHFGA